MNMATFHSVFTVVLVIIFVGIVVWAFSGRRKRDFAEAANLPFEHEDAPPPVSGQQGDRS